MHPNVERQGVYAPPTIGYDHNCLRCHSRADVEDFYASIELKPVAIDSVSRKVVFEPYYYFNYPWWYLYLPLENRMQRDMDDSYSQWVKTKAKRQHRELRFIPGF